jgi:hypothetical protein
VKRDEVELAPRSREAFPARKDPVPGPAPGLAESVLRLQRSAGNAAVSAMLAREPAPAPAPAAAADAADPKAAEAKKGEPTAEDKAEFETLKSAITLTSVEAYVKKRREKFGDKADSDEEYVKASKTADDEFDGIKNLIGQAEDSMAARKLLYRWLRKDYGDDAVKTVKAGMTPELKAKLDAVKDSMGGRKAGGFAARPQKVGGDYILGTLSDHATGKAADIAPEKNPQIPSSEWTWIKTFTGESPDLSAESWKKDPKAMWKAVNDTNEAFKKKLKEKITEATAPAAAASTATPAATPPVVAKADAPAAPVKSEADVIKDVLKDVPVVRKCVQDNGKDSGFFELPEDLVVALHGQDLLWGATFTNVDLHHFQMQ